MCSVSRLQHCQRLVMLRGERAKPLPLPDKPSIAVLPFDNIGHDREEEYLADGIVEDIIAALSRVRSSFVIARNSTFIYKGRAVNVQQVSRELGVRYVPEGSVRRSRNRVRVTAQLIDAATGAHFWGERYEGLVDDIFDFQDEITASVVSALQPSIRAAEVERARRKMTRSLDAYDLVMRLSLRVGPMTQPPTGQRPNSWRKHSHSIRAIYSLALALAAWCSAHRVFYIWSKDIEGDKCHSTRRLAWQRISPLTSDRPDGARYCADDLARVPGGTDRDREGAGARSELSLGMEPQCVSSHRLR